MTYVPSTGFATCEDCHQEMKIGSGCTVTHVSKGENAPLVKRIFYGEESDDWGAGEGRPCHDCNAGAGKPHHAGCDVERCPECGHQMLMCLGSDPAEAEFAQELSTLMGGTPCGWTHLAVVK